VYEVKKYLQDVSAGIGRYLKEKYLVNFRATWRQTRQGQLLTFPGTIRVMSENTIPLSSYLIFQSKKYRLLISSVPDGEKQLLKQGLSDKYTYYSVHLRNLPVDCSPLLVSYIVKLAVDFISFGANISW
jgi:hypothetical protein